MKKSIITFVLAIMIATIFGAGIQQTTTGTTTSSYVTVFTADYEDKIQGGVTLKNTGTSSKDIQFQVIAYMHPDATEYRVLATADDLEDGETATININDTYFNFIIQVMYPAGGGASTYSCSYRVSR